MTKAIIAEGDQMEAGPKWMASRRAILRVFDDHLECGNWTIAYEDILDSRLASFRTPVLRFPGYVLSVRTEEHTYHFGLNGTGKFWQGNLPFPVDRIESRLRLSWISLAARIMVAIGIGILLWRWLT